MSRSKHTRPPHILAAMRLRAPRESRGCGDRSVQQRILRGLKRKGIVLESAHPPLPQDPILCRITVQRPRAGHHHPVTKTDIETVLRFLGEKLYYGLRSVELSQGQEASWGGKMSLGRLSMPGRIILYDVPYPPWLLAGTLEAKEVERLRRAGALVNVSIGGFHTRIDWPGGTLHDFMLFDVLLHEVGHHMIQHYKGKRGMRVVRTREHEAFADRFAQHCRERWKGKGCE